MTKTINDIGTFSNSRLGVLKTCYRKYFFSYIKEWQTEGFSAALAFGGAFHDALECFFSVMQKTKILTEAYDLMIAQLPIIWEANNLPIDPFEQEALGMRSFNNLNAILTYWYEQNITWLHGIEVIEPEKEFLVEFQNLNFLIGKIDLVYKSLVDNKIYFLEHKTSSSYSKDYGFQYAALNKWEDDSQTHQYAYAGRMLYGKRFGGVVMNLNLVHKKVRYNVRRPIIFIDESLEDWYNATAFYIDQVTNENSPVSKADYPRNHSACWDLYGQCSYLKLCQTALSISDYPDDPPEGYAMKDSTKGLFISDEMKMDILKSTTEEAL